MNWIVPTEDDNGTATLEKRLWDSADQFRANSGLKAQEYSGTVRGINFLRFAEVARSIHKQREVLLRQIQTLRRTRGLLLPRRLSGQVELASLSANGATLCQPGATPQVMERNPRKG